MSEESTAQAADAAVPQPDASTLKWVHEAVGDRFLAYVLGCDEQQLSDLMSEATKPSELQSSVLAVFELIRAQLPPELTENTAVDTVIQAWVAQLQENGLTVARALRAQSGAEDDLPVGTDDLERAIATLAADVYPIMLLPPEAQMAALRDYSIHVTRVTIYHPAAKLFGDLALADPRLSKTFPHERDGDRYGMIVTNLGWGSSLQLIMLPETIFQTTWRRLKGTQLTPNVFVNEAIATLRQLRSVFSGNVEPIRARFAFTGVLMPEGSIITVRNGVVRPTLEAERDLAPESLRQQLSTTDESGNQVLIGYDGDIVYDYQFPYKARTTKRKLEEPATGFPDDMNLPDEFEHDSLLIRFSLMLAVERRDRVQLVQTWRNYDDPLRLGFATSWNDSRLAASLMPAKLTEQEVESWQKWYDLLNTPDVARIELALSRILRALAERSELSDVLIDAVIAWENLFGHKEEATLRVTLCLARLLADTAEKRVELRTELGKIYGLRSNIVHGAAPLKVSDNPKCQRALEIAIDAVRALVSKRPDVLRLKDGVTRSNAMIVE